MIDFGTQALLLTIVGGIAVRWRIHAVHHADTEVDATILPLLDHLSRTAAYLPAEQHKSLRVGLEYFREAYDVRLDQMLLIPFRSGFSVTGPRKCAGRATGIAPERLEPVGDVPISAWKIA